MSMALACKPLTAQGALWILIEKQIARFVLEANRQYYAAPTIVVPVSGGKGGAAAPPPIAGCLPDITLITEVFTDEHAARMLFPVNQLRNLAKVQVRLCSELCVRKC
jgi:hypothetical protein